MQQSLQGVDAQSRNRGECGNIEPTVTKGAGWRKGAMPGDPSGPEVKKTKCF